MMQTRVQRARERIIGALRLSPMTTKQLVEILWLEPQTVNKYMREFVEEGKVWRDTSRANSMGRGYYVFHLVQP